MEMIFLELSLSWVGFLIKKRKNKEERISFAPEVGKIE
jgi:hypothetical protein